MKKSLLLFIGLIYIFSYAKAQNDFLRERPYSIGLKIGGALMMGSVETELNIYKRLTLIAGGGFGYYGGLKYYSPSLRKKPTYVYIAACPTFFAPPWADFGTSRFIYIPAGIHLFGKRGFGLSGEIAFVGNSGGGMFWSGACLSWRPKMRKDD